MKVSFLHILLHFVQLHPTAIYIPQENHLLLLSKTFFVFDATESSESEPELCLVEYPCVLGLNPFSWLNHPTFCLVLSIRLEMRWTSFPGGHIYIYISIFILHDFSHRSHRYPAFFGTFRLLKLLQVQQLASTASAFAAIRSDGSVVTWGHPERGGDSSRAQERLKEVQQIEAWRVVAKIPKTMEKPGLVEGNWMELDKHSQWNMDHLEDLEGFFSDDLLLLFGLFWGTLKQIQSQLPLGWGEKHQGLSGIDQDRRLFTGMRSIDKQRPFSNWLDWFSLKTQICFMNFDECLTYQLWRPLCLVVWFPFPIIHQLFSILKSHAQKTRPPWCDQFSRWIKSVEVQVPIDWPQNLVVYPHSPVNIYR